MPSVRAVRHGTASIFDGSASDPFALTLSGLRPSLRVGRALAPDGRLAVFPEFWTQRLNKNEIRREVLARRDAIPGDARIEKSLAAAQNALTLRVLDDLVPGTVVSGFLPIRSEIDARPLMDALRARGARLCLPAVIDRETIVFRELLRTAELVPTGFGTVGPGPDAAVLEPELLIVPLAAFDRRGNRLGYGAGHYDRAIARLDNPMLVGLAFAEQEVASVPAEPHDRVLHAVATDSEAFEVR